MALKLEIRKMRDRSLKKNKDEPIPCEIKNGKFYREGAIYTYIFPSNVTDACIDAFRHADPNGIRHSLSEEVIGLLEDKDTIQDKLKIAQLDKNNVIAAYLATYPTHSTNDILKLLMSEDEYLVSFGVGLAVITKMPMIIPPSNTEGLYKYFRSKKINEDELKHFTSEKFIDHSFHRIQSEERIIFTWMIENLISLLELNAINIEKNSKFFVSLLRENDYPNDAHMKLFLSVIEKNPKFIEDLLKLKLCIDPFTKQYNYSKWLKEVRKFSFISNLRKSLPEMYISNEVLLFDKRKADLYRINKNDPGLDNTYH